MSTEPALQPPLPWSRGRDAAVDLIRGLAVIFMIIAHVRVWAPADSTVVTIALALINNVASPLFAVVMGISAGIVLTRGERPVEGGPFVTRTVVRGLILILLGLALEQLHTIVAIVLMSLGTTLIVAAPLTLLPVPLLAATATLTFVLGPSINAAARAALDPTRVRSGALVDQVFQWIVLSTHYRMVSLLPFVLAGVVLARIGLGRRAAVGALVVGLGAGVGVLLLRLSGRGAGLSAVVSGDVPDALMDVALAGCTLGVVVLLARWRPMAPVVTALAPVRAVGTMALTAYLLHVGLIAVVMRSMDWQETTEHWLVIGAGILLGTILACWAWWHVLGRGPIERLMAMVTTRIG